MGLFSSIGKVLFGDPTKDIRRAAGVQQAGFQRGEEYLTGIDELPLELRNQALQQLQGFYSGDPGAQQSFIDRARSSPFYDALIQQGGEGVLSRAGPMGLTRSGNAFDQLNQSNQNVLRGLVGQNLQGLQGFTDPRLNTANITNMMTGGAGAEAGGITAAAQAEQDLAGQTVGLIMQGAGAYMSDVLLKENIEFNGVENGYDTYTWDWNKLAKLLFGLAGSGFGVIANEVERINPSVVGTRDGYKTVQYDLIGVKHG